MQSSYETKIYPRLLATALGQVMWERIINRLLSMKVNDYAFKNSSGSGNGDTSIKTEIYFQYLIDDGSIDYQMFSSEFQIQNITSDHIVLTKFYLIKDDPDDVILNCFGKDKGVPTFNCTKSVCLDGRFKFKNTVPSFSVWIWRQIQDSKIYSDTQKRLHDQILNLFHSSEFRQNKLESQAQFACTEIKDIMMKYSWLGDDVLKRAIQTFVIGDVLDT